MNVEYINPGFNAMIESIMLFQTEGETPLWSDALFYFFPKLNKDIFMSLNFNEKNDYLSQQLKETY